jgi:truncated hemoglobin YjbI
MSENLLQKLGGQDKVNQLVEVYLDKMLDDPRVCNRYIGQDLDAVKDKYKTTLAQLFAGESAVVDCYLGLGVTSEEFALALINFESAARELGISYDTCELLGASLKSLKDQVVGK